VHVVQIEHDMRAQFPYFIRWRQEIGNHDRHHAGGIGGADTVVRVLQGQAELGRYTQLFGRLQEGIGRGLVASIVAMRHDVVESADEVVGFQVTLNRRA
jgi:hypothetical protein